ncbi:MAG: ABC transporter ATP-binding protein [Gammaproteobacteria bacterium]
MQPIIRFDNVTVKLPHKTLLSEISFTIYPGQKSLIRGKSGAGKSSVLKTLLGLHSPTSGTIYFQEQALTVETVQKVRQCTTYIGQEPILGAETVRDALLLPFQFQAHRHHHPNESALVDALQRLQLPSSVLGQSTQRISGGEKQRVALARGLLLGKTVYLLDEATSALDAESKQAVFDIFADPQFTVVAITHDVDWLTRSATVYEMAKGRLMEVKEHGNT